MKSHALIAAIVFVLSSGVLIAQDTRPASPSLRKTSFGKLPIYFVENRGVYREEVKYYIKGADKILFFTKEGITFRLKGEDRGWVVKLEFAGANPDVVPRGEDQKQAVFSYFRGPEKDWKTGLRTYSKIVYSDLWPGIDLVYRGAANQLKYEFVVKPGAVPEKIRLRYRGVTEVKVLDSGALGVTTPLATFEDAAPIAWQEVDGRRMPVRAGFKITCRAQVSDFDFGFHVGEYDWTRPLVLDPAILVYCGFIGGAGSEDAYGIAVDPSGNAYVAGTTCSTQVTFPVSVGPDLTYNGDIDVFVAKVNASGTALVYCGYIGGSGRDEGYAIALDQAGNAYVAGWTESTEATFPVKIGPDVTFNGGNNCPDAFVAKVNTSGAALDYCGYIGGTDYDLGSGIAVDPLGNAYVTGKTISPQNSFPVKIGPDLTWNGNNDAFVAKVNTSGTALDYCGYIGGAWHDHGIGIAVDSSGTAYVAGSAESTEATFPVTVGPDLTHNGKGIPDGFVARVNPTGTGLLYCGYIGGACNDWCSGIVLDRSGNAYVAGLTMSNQTTFPVKVGPDMLFNGINDAFVAKVNAAGTALLYCGYIGGASQDNATGVAVDPSGNAYVTGWTDSPQDSFPVKVGPDLAFNGKDDAFVAKVNAQGTSLVYCGYIGGSGFDRGHGMTVDTAGNAFVVGRTYSTQATFPVKVGPDLTFNGSTNMWDAFVTKVALLDSLSASGTTRPGGAVKLNLAAVEVRGLPYQVGTSLGLGPISIDTRELNLGPDGLLAVSAGNLWPTVFSGYQGLIDNQGKAQASINIPNDTALIGVRVHSAFVTLDPHAPSGIKSISDTFSFTITK